jgi:superfamily II DNA or RNA helicase
MLPRQPLRFLLADDPGAGKTIMAGLFIKELIARGDLQRCLVVCPGSLTEQWQDELYRRFQLSFEILTNDKLEEARTGNWFLENNLVIARLDKLSRDEVCAGLAHAKAKGKTLGRSATARVKSDRIHELCSQGLNKTQIAHQLHIGRASVFLALNINGHKSPAALER